MAFESRHPVMPTQRDFHEAIGRAGDAWYGACLRITRNQALAQDAVQDALLSAWSKREQFHGNSKLETWIHRIAINSALSLVRKQKPVAETTPEELPDHSEPSLEARSNEEVGRDLAVALEALSEMERICFCLRHLEQWRLKEIAEKLDTGVGPVKQALFRGLSKLRATMACRWSES